ncbi:hypothetical protein E0500_025015 [Streptomyces sp. KM273126]|uniref:hypothetical protein n=1 Tax=Streptomyces sp. KM273126 TaxID=2545247 RepID=UPI0014053A4D|nr:hypothetical protein [Streptomyces sp. KM273126]MBA2810566.1 hypothetical protein [Streptomyces sp. KM273126]
MLHNENVSGKPAVPAREITPIAERIRPSIALVDQRFAEDMYALRDSVLPSLTVVESRRSDSGPMPRCARSTD